MEFLPKLPTGKAPAEIFTGHGFVDRLHSGVSPSRVRLNLVRFAPCARTNWHVHPLGQTLYVTEGIGLIQARGGKILIMRPGDVVHTPPDEWHWHGATRDNFMSHLSISEAPESGEPETRWGEPVTDAEYDRQPSSS